MKQIIIGNIVALVASFFKIKNKDKDRAFALRKIWMAKA